MEATDRRARALRIRRVAAGLFALGPGGLVWIGATVSAWHNMGPRAGLLFMGVVGPTICAVLGGIGYLIGWRVADWLDRRDGRA